MSPADQLFKVHAILAEGQKIQRILLIRSGQMPVVRNALELLQDRFPAARIEALAQPAVAEELRTHPAVAELQLYDEDVFSIRRLGPGRLRELITRHYDLALVIYSDVQGKGYYQVRKLARGIRPRHVLAYNVRDELRLLEGPLHPAAALLGWIVYWPLLLTVTSGLLLLAAGSWLRDLLRPTKTE